MRLAQYARIVVVLIIAIGASGTAAAPVTRTEIVGFLGVHDFSSAFGASGSDSQSGLSISYAVSADRAVASSAVANRFSVSFDSLVPLSSAAATNIELNFGGLVASYLFAPDVDLRTVITSSFLLSSVSAEVLQDVSEVAGRTPPLPVSILADHNRFLALPTQSGGNGTLRADSSYLIDVHALLTLNALTGNIRAIHEGGTQRNFGFDLAAAAEIMQLDLGLPGQWFLFFTDLQVEGDLQLEYFFSLNSTLKFMLGDLVQDQFSLVVDRVPLYSFTGDLNLRTFDLAPSFSIFVDDGTNSVPAPGTLLLCLIGLTGLAFNRGRRH